MINGSISREQLIAKKVIAYSIDALIPGFYLWLGNWSIRIGGSEPEDNYPSVTHSLVGMALVLQGFRSWTVYHGSHEPNKVRIDGLSEILDKTMPDVRFGQLLSDAGYKKIYMALAKGNRIKSWWTHPTYRRVEVITSADATTVVTAYHIE